MCDKSKCKCMYTKWNQISRTGWQTSTGFISNLLDSNNNQHKSLSWRMSPSVNVHNAHLITRTYKRTQHESCSWYVILITCRFNLVPIAKIINRKHTGLSGGLCCIVPRPILCHCFCLCIILLTIYKRIRWWYVCMFKYIHENKNCIQIKIHFRLLAAK